MKDKIEIVHCEYCRKEISIDKAYISTVSGNKYCNEDCHSDDIDKKYSYYRH